MASKILKRKILVFVACASLSAIAWLTNQFSKQYEKQVLVKIEYTDIPEQKSIVDAPDVVLVRIKTTGWNLLFRSSLSRTIQINLSEYSSLYSITIPDVQPILEETFESMDIVQVYPESITILMEDLLSKKVPVHILIDSSSLESGHFMKSLPTSDPDSVTITGTSQEIHAWTSLNTSRINVSDYTEPFDEKVALHIDKSKIHAAFDSVQVIVPIEPYAEKVIDDVPIAVVLYDTLHIELFPQTIKLKCLAPFSSYQNIEAKDFHIIADFDNIDYQNEQSISLKVMKSPEAVKFIEMIPSEVTFLIYQ